MDVKVDRKSASQGARPKREEIVVFSIVRNSDCAECGSELGRGRFIRLENQRALCLSCADLDHLVYLPSGNTALTRLATNYSTLWAVVVRFSRSRKRYERQGVMVEESALERADLECHADEEARALARKRAAERRAELDKEFVTAFAQQIGELFPQCPRQEQRAIAEHACRKYSGRIGRSAAAKQFDADAVNLAVRAHVRHAHTRYDELLIQGWSRGDARAEVESRMEEVLQGWEARPSSDHVKDMSPGVAKPVREELFGP
ncbi:MAG TPA: DUF2293 domain-containing protein [Candidatus Methylomirabilis sp.]|nr:DUF2293 domain-containing protein [Candidatus Methylomirabilis sp.]